MKTLISTILAFAISFTTFAGGKAYEQAMGKAISEMYAAQDLAAFDNAANKFTRIGDAEKDQWLPYYYASLSYVFKGFRINDLQQKDAVLDLAMKSIDKAATLAPNNVEIIAMHGFINMIKIGVDPGTRGQSLSPGIYADFTKAIQLDPKNPRATLFMAQMQYGTAQFFGSGLEDACQMVETSIVLFDSGENKDALMPAWGKESALQYREMCSAQTNSEE